MIRCRPFVNDASCESGYYNVQLMSFLVQTVAEGPFTFSYTIITFSVTVSFSICFCVSISFVCQLDLVCLSWLLSFSITLCLIDRSIYRYRSSDISSCSLWVSLSVCISVWQWMIGSEPTFSIRGRRQWSNLGKVPSLFFLIIFLCQVKKRRGEWEGGGERKETLSN